MHLQRPTELNSPSENLAKDHATAEKDLQTHVEHRIV